MSLIAAISAATIADSDAKAEAMSDFVSGNVPMGDLLLPLLTSSATSTQLTDEQPLAAADVAIALEIYVRQTYRTHNIINLTRYVIDDDLVLVYQLI